MVIDSAHFGTVEVDNEKIIVFEKGLPGFEEIKRFAIISVQQTRPFLWLQSLEQSSVALPLIDPFEVLDSYSIDVADEDITELNLDRQEDLLVFNVAVIPENLSLMTANLAAPILINVRRGIGRQVVIDTKDYRVREPIFDQVCKMLDIDPKGGATNAGAEQAD